MTARALPGQGAESPPQLAPPGMVAPRSLLTTLQVSLSLHLQCCLLFVYSSSKVSVIDVNTVMSDLHIKLLFHRATCHLTHTQRPSAMFNCGYCIVPTLEHLPTHTPLLQDRPDSAHIVPYLLLGTKFVLSLSFNSPPIQKQISHRFILKHVQ